MGTKKGVGGEESCTRPPPGRARPRTARRSRRTRAHVAQLHTVSLLQLRLAVLTGRMMTDTATLRWQHKTREYTAKMSGRTPRVRPADDGHSPQQLAGTSAEMPVNLDASDEESAPEQKPDPAAPSHTEQHLLMVQRHAQTFRGECLSREFSMQAMEWKCSRGHEWTAGVQQVLHQFVWCPHWKCQRGKHPVTTDAVTQFVARRSVECHLARAKLCGCELREDAPTEIDAVVRWRCRMKACAAEFEQSLFQSTHVPGVCPECEANRQLYLRRLSEKAAAHGGQIVRLDEPHLHWHRLPEKTRVRVLCEHKHEFLASIAQLMDGAWCVGPPLDRLPRRLLTDDAGHVPRQVPAVLRTALRSLCAGRPSDARGSRPERRGTAGARQRARRRDATLRLPFGTAWDATDPGLCLPQWGQREGADAGECGGVGSGAGATLPRGRGARATTNGGLHERRTAHEHAARPRAAGAADASCAEGGRHRAACSRAAAHAGQRQRGAARGTEAQGAGHCSGGRGQGRGGAVRARRWSSGGCAPRGPRPATPARCRRPGPRLPAQGASATAWAS